MMNEWAEMTFLCRAGLGQGITRMSEDHVVRREETVRTAATDGRVLGRRGSGPLPVRRMLPVSEDMPLIKRWSTLDRLHSQFETRVERQPPGLQGREFYALGAL
jgi:hypothetical protein